jgi:hypothetical protein
VTSKVEARKAYIVSRDFCQWSHHGLGMRKIGHILARRVDVECFKLARLRQHLRFKAADEFVV